MLGALGLMNITPYYKGLLPVVYETHRLAVGVGRCTVARGVQNSVQCTDEMFWW